MATDPLRHALSRRLRRPRAPLRAHRLFRGHRRLRHRLLRQLSEVHGAGAVRHDPRGRGRPGRRASRRAAALMRWSRSTSATGGRRGSATICWSSARSSRSAQSSVDIHQRVMRGTGTVDRRAGDCRLPRRRRPAAAAAEGLGRKVQGNQRTGAMTARFASFCAARRSLCRAGAGAQRRQPRRPWSRSRR